MPNRNTYDHRLRELVSRTRDLDLAERLGVPRPTVQSWLRRGLREVVSADVLDDDAGQLRVRVLRLQRRAEVLLAIVRLLLLLVRMAGLGLDAKRLPGGEQKQQLLDGIARATRSVPRSIALRVVGLRPSRYHAWRQKAPCHLDDRTSCPKTRPTQLASNEVHAMRDMVTSLDFRHFSIRALALSYSNSMIEAWWRNSRNSWLYLHTLDSVTAVEKLVVLYVEQHNSVMPCRAFNGRTPDEVYFGNAAEVEDELAERRRQARAERVVANRAVSCATCQPRGAPAEAVSRDAA